jgi:hypothetical protein
MKTARTSWYQSRRTLVGGGAGIGLVAAVAALFAFGPNKDAAPERFTNEPVIVPAVQIKAPLSDEARKVAVRFIQTAVARENLAEAWTLAGPNVRGGLTRKEWLTGNIPVVPYPLDSLEVAPYKVDESFTKSALLEVALLAKKGANIKSQIFFLQLVKVGEGENTRWVVDNWVPRGSAVTPR